MFIGVDTGGTFTDFVLLDGAGLRVLKVLSTPRAPEQAILEGLSRLGFASEQAREALRIVHGSTVATNAALERKGVRTAFVTNRGLADMLTLGRQARGELYALEPRPPEPPVPAELCFEVPARLDARGREIEAPTEAALARLATDVAAARPAAVAINLLFSWLDPAHELAVEAALRARLGDDVVISRSSFVLPEYREYERGIATWLNAWLGPRVQGYLQRLGQGAAPARVAVMQSSGGTIDAGLASERAVNLLLSGPAGGLAAAAWVGGQCGHPRLLTFDMGGTSTDVALVDGEPTLTSEGRLGPWPVAVPMMDIHTIGAGGGSIARLDAGGALQVGPESAGADPGPACYGRGGSEATVTDAHLVLGHIRPDARLGGDMTLDADAAFAALTALGDRLGCDALDAARGVLLLAEEHMARALRVMSIERGRDPRSFTLCCFGGAGGLHLCSLAAKLGMTRALLPPMSGVLSALGMLVAAPERQLSRTLRSPLAELTAADIGAVLGELATQGRAELEAEGHAEVVTAASLDLRFEGQAAWLNLPWAGDPQAAAEAFRAAHRDRYGHALGTPVELVNIRLRCSAPATPPTLEGPAATAASASVGTVELPDHGATAVLQRAALQPGAEVDGPALVMEDTATTLILAGWRARVLGNGALELLGEG